MRMGRHAGDQLLIRQPERRLVHAAGERVRVGNGLQLPAVGAVKLVQGEEQQAEGKHAPADEQQGAENIGVGIAGDEVGRNQSEQEPVVYVQYMVRHEQLISVCCGELEHAGLPGSHVGHHLCDVAVGLRIRAGLKEVVQLEEGLQVGG